MAKRVGFVFTIVFLAGVLGAPIARAESECPLSKEKLAGLKSVQNNYSLDYLEEIRAELGIRRSLLKDAVLCAMRDATTLRANLAGASISDPDIQKTQTRSIGELTDALNYYELQKNLVDDLGLQGSKNFARSLSDWRAGNYRPTAKRALDIIIWARNQNILDVAQKRIDQVGRTARLLKIVDNEEIQNLFKEADDDFQLAAQFNQKATDILRVDGDTDEFLSNTKLSLDALSKTYQKFFELSDALNKVLPR